MLHALHARIAFRDEAALFPRNALLLLRTDPQRLFWPKEQRAQFAASEEMRLLLDEFPPCAHVRPEWGIGSRIFLSSSGCGPTHVSWGTGRHPGNYELDEFAPPRFSPHASLCCSQRSPHTAAGHKGTVMPDTAPTKRTKQEKH